MTHYSCNSMSTTLRDSQVQYELFFCYRVKRLALACGARVRSDNLTGGRFIELHLPLANFDPQKPPVIKRRKVA
jgi:hypothetical protein